MWRMLLTVTVAVSFSSVLLGQGSAKVIVIGKTKAGPVHIWVDKKTGMESTPAKVGDPAGRLEIRVKNGDIVRFEVEGNVKHGVVFENAVPEMDTGIWKVHGGTFKLMELPLGSFHQPPYDFKKARCTDRMGAKDYFEIEIQALKPRMAILFGCNPHSGGKNEKVPMLGKIVLDEKKKTD